MPDILSVLTFYDITWCAFGALIMTFLIRKIIYFVRLLRDETQFVNNPAEFNHILEKWYKRFPLDMFNFNGETFRRGSVVRITTSAARTIEGKIIGLNENDELCVITRTFISAEKLINIAEIKVLD